MTNDPPTAPPGLVHGQLCYLQVPTLDITISARFYETVFGWQVDPPSPGFEAPAMIGQWITDRPPSADTGSVGWFYVDHIDDTLALATARGGGVLHAPSQDANGRWLATILDPAGNALGVVQTGRR